ncbi:MAG TPA: thiamine-binding protein [Pseudogracilibacillus sp.]|nr:thiamine-binding protein [Pseudogracilibacillus sp.]
MNNALISVQILPSVPYGQEVYDYVDKAIEVIKQANVTYKVSPLETTMEGNLTELLEIVQQMNIKMEEMGAKQTIFQVKILYRQEGIAMNTLMEKY